MPPSLCSWPKVLEKLLTGENLTSSESNALMHAWLDEELLPVQTGAFLAALRAKQATGDELGAMAKVLREACTFPFPVPTLPMVDTCGTGGDGADTFNISTAVAFTSASLGVNVAKHGNRSASGKVGSADVLEGLGIKLDAPIELVVDVIKQTNVTFLFAPIWHSSLVNLAPLRKSLGVRTVFNLLGPLVNPFRPNAQVLGVASSDLLDPMAHALKELGLTKAVVVHGAGGLDEASLEGPNEVRFLQNGQITKSFVDPNYLGLSKAPNESLKGGDLSKNQEILMSVLTGKASSAQRQVVALNTALVLWVGGIEEDLKKGTELALNTLNTKKPWEKFEELRNSLKTEINK